VNWNDERCSKTFSGSQTGDGMINGFKRDLTDSMRNLTRRRLARKLGKALNNSPAAAFCRQMTQVASISVDNPGMEVTSSGQKGIWVQWP
jgi:hypothetical protein